VQEQVAERSSWQAPPQQEDSTVPPATDAESALQRHSKSIGCVTETARAAMTAVSLTVSRFE
jgi:hypothetical protein